MQQNRQQGIHRCLDEMARVRKGIARPGKSKQTTERMTPKPAGGASGEAIQIDA